MRRTILSGELCEGRRLTAAGQIKIATGEFAAESACIAPLAALVAGVEPQYVVYQTPRLQPGNAPLVGTPAFAGVDQVEVLWQTMTVGAGHTDTFEVSYRPVGNSSVWQPAPLNPPLDTGVETRIIHSATILGLNWDADYEYRVLHRRAGELVETYQQRFHTRLEPGDSQPFRFAAYGDSAIAPPNAAAENFRAVQDRINRMDPDFAVLLGDNIYDFGSHPEADVRFHPGTMPEAADWIAGHVDYFAIGNHDGAGLGLGSGQPSRDSYSVPVPVTGVNAYASLPEGEYAEHTFSFDYGNTHLVTFDSNPVESSTAESLARVEALIDFVIADLEASPAQWKIVYTHHPIIGTAKSYDDPNSNYFQQMLPRLVESGADLLMVGDSHTYSWTHALSGYSDRNQNGIITADEVDVVRDTDRRYPKGAGLIQLVAGVGGRSLYGDPYPDPIFGAAYSTHEATGPVEYGFAHVEVTQDRLTVSYISAATGRIVGDLNGNWRADDDEPYFGRFQIVDASVSRGDLTGDSVLDDADIDLLAAALRTGDPDPRYDLNADAVNNSADYDLLIESIVDVPRGDANLDSVFNSSDLVLIFQVGKYETAQAASWADGDWNGDGLLTTADLVLVFQLGTYRPS